MNSNYLIWLVIVTIFFACQSTEAPNFRATDYDFPNPVNTGDKTLVQQQRKVYEMDGISFDNRFEGARLSDVKKKNDSTFTVLVLPENEPINRSPWYAFQVYSNSPKDIYIELDYGKYEHRYDPKISEDRTTWVPIENDLLIYNSDSTTLTFPISVKTDIKWISAQELFTSKDLPSWMSSISEHNVFHNDVIGQSRGGRDLHFMDFYADSKEGKDLIVIFSRLHPPEVTGFMAMQAFVEGLLNSTSSDQFFQRFRVIVYPMLNPDGVDWGHWRHNLGGVDLNRDWAYYRQTEVRQVADHVVHEAMSNNNRVVLGFDFHSTFNDVFYTQSSSELITPTTSWFRGQWFKAIEGEIEGYKVNEKPSGLGSPVTKGWFYTQFGAEGMTYEIGDNTPRDSIEIIGTVAAEQMIKVLLTNGDF